MTPPRTLRPHDPRWNDAYAREAALLKDCLHPGSVDLHHIGSTAIPGILAKPVIDILISSRSLADVDARTPLIAALGYEPRGEHGIPGRRYFKKRPMGTRTGFHVHAFECGAREIVRHIQFRDYLLRHPEIAEEYSALKKFLGDADGALPADYSTRKAAFISEVLDRAARYFSLNGADF